MTDLDRFERRLPDLMAELSPPGIPDYFDDMLRTSARTRQRPSWASLERLIPMEITARSAPFGLPSWRPVLTLAVILALLVAAGAVLVAGSKRSLPPLFGPARNGAVIYGTTTGDILSLDPATGTAVTIIGGDSDDHYPNVSPDGQRLQFVRLDDPATLYTSNVDGTGVQAVASAKDANWSEWSPNGEQLVYIAEGGGTPYIRDVVDGTTRALPVSTPVTGALFLTDAQLLLLSEHEGVNHSMWTINADGTDQRRLTTPNACCGTSVLPGRGLVAWTSWDVSANTLGRTHVMDVATGTDRLLPSTEKAALHFLDPRFSPDGKWLLVSEFVASSDGVQPGLIAADGTGAFIPIGRRLPKNDSAIHTTFSPDGAQVLVTYDDGSAWLYAIPSGQGAPVDWTGLVETSWQRLAIAD